MVLLSMRYGSVVRGWRALSNAATGRLSKVLRVDPVLCPETLGTDPTHAATSLQRYLPG